MPAARAQLARRRLETLCRRDPEFPSAIVWTIYYDTPALVSLGEKVNSDYLKRKIRVRWYSDLEGRVTGPAFVEAKLRVGTRRSKARARLPYPADEVARWDLQDTRLQRLALLLRDQGVLGQDRVAADDAPALSPRSLHRAAHPVARQPGCRDCRGAGEPAVSVGYRPVAVGNRRARGERRLPTSFLPCCARFWRSVAARARSRSYSWCTRT